MFAVVFAAAADDAADAAARRPCTMSLCFCFRTFSYSGASPWRVPHAEALAMQAIATKTFARHHRLFFEKDIWAMILTLL